MEKGYIKRVLREMSSSRLVGYIDSVHKANGKPKLFIVIDMLWCTLLYGAGFSDYVIFEFYKIKHAQRKTYMTRLKNKKFVLEMNDPAYTEVFDEKNIFYKNFSEFLGRKFLDLGDASKEEVADFVQGKEYVIAKPNNGECGEGIEKIALSRFASAEEAAEYLKDPVKNFGVVEELLIQHPEMSRLYPHSVNCLRMVTLVKDDGTAKCLYAVLKTGNNGKFVDNLENGGYACHMDMSTGVVIGPGHTNRQDKVEVHPATGVAFRGFQVPNVKEAVELVEKAALVIPKVRYIGWDVCILPEGAAIIEGNNYTAYDFPQLPDDSVPATGLLKIIKDNQ